MSERSQSLRRQLTDLFIELLDKYEKDEHQLNSEFSGNIVKANKELDDAVEEYRKRFQELTLKIFGEA